VLFVLLAVATTGWVVTATRDRAAVVSAPPTEPVRQPESVIIPVPVPVVVSPPESSKSDSLVKKPSIVLPEGHSMLSLRLSVFQIAAGFIGPGSRPDIIAIGKRGHKPVVFTLLRHVMVVAVDTTDSEKASDKEPKLVTVSFAVTQKQAMAVSLAKARGCNLELLLPSPRIDDTTPEENEKILDEIIKVLQDEKWWKEVPPEGKGKGEGKPTEPLLVAPDTWPKGEGRASDTAFGSRMT